MEMELDRIVQKLSIEEEPVAQVILPAEVVANKPCRFYLVGELLTQKPYRRESLVSVLRSLWIPERDKGDRSLLQASFLDGSKRILFSFKREEDRRWVLGGTPWDFEKSLMAIAPTDGMEDPRLVSLRFTPFWIRIRGLPPVVVEGNKRGATARCIGSVLGEFVKLGDVGGWSRQNNYLRFRVAIDVEAPLKKKIAFRLAGEEISKLYDVEYERLPFFCLFCGLLSHTGNVCPLKTNGEVQEPRFTIYLNAERKERWLQQMEDEERLRAFQHPSGNSRFGIRPKVVKGWRMQAPELPASGFRRSRLEMEDDSLDSQEGALDAMEVEKSSSQETEFGVSQPAKKQRGEPRGRGKEALVAGVGSRQPGESQTQQEKGGTGHLREVNAFPFPCLTRKESLLSDGTEGGGMLVLHKEGESTDLIMDTPDFETSKLGVLIVPRRSGGNSEDATLIARIWPKGLTEEEKWAGPQTSSIVVKPKSGNSKILDCAGAVVQQKEQVCGQKGWEGEVNSVMGPVSTHHAQ